MNPNSRSDRELLATLTAISKSLATIAEIMQRRDEEKSAVLEK